jgi:hypothetical protein
MCKNVGPALQFVRQYGPALRWYNPELQLNKRASPEGPLAMVIEVYKANAAEPITVVPDDFKKPEELLDRIKVIDSLQ